MSLSSSYTNVFDYFKDALQFLNTNQWLIRYPNTKILTEKLLNNFPNEWLIHFQSITTQELNELPFGVTNDKWPDSLKQFLRKIESLKPKYKQLIPKQDLKLSARFMIGLNKKKRHEILSLAPFIYENCHPNNIHTILDIGTGLGYLPQLLFEKYNYKVIGIEGDREKLSTAINRQNHLYSDSINHVQYVEHYVTEQSVDFIKNLIQTSGDVCLIGLHACSDLSVVLLKLFLHIDNIRQVVAMPCCYHRLLKTNKNEDKSYVNFPVSSALRQIYKDENGSEYLTTPFLRLACQNTGASWRLMSYEEHRKHSIGAMQRAVLQLVADQGGLQLSRLKRKSNTSKDSLNTFCTYLKQLKSTHTLYDPSNPNEELISSPLFCKQMTLEWSKYEANSMLLEIYTAFQTAVQAICENIVLLDRIQMIHELCDYDCHTLKVSNDAISARCLAIVAKKPNRC